MPQTAVWDAVAAAVTPASHSTVRISGLPRELLLDVCHGIEKFVVGIVASFAFVNVLEARGEFDGRNPFNHFESQLIFHAKSKGAP
jgi:hypothetical protein